MNSQHLFALIKGRFLRLFQCERLIWPPPAEAAQSLGRPAKSAYRHPAPQPPRERGRRGRRAHRGPVLDVPPHPPIRGPRGAHPVLPEHSARRQIHGPPAPSGPLSRPGPALRPGAPACPQRPAGPRSTGRQDRSGPHPASPCPHGFTRSPPLRARIHAFRPGAAHESARRPAFAPAVPARLSRRPCSPHHRYGPPGPRVTARPRAKPRGCDPASRLRVSDRLARPAPRPAPPRGAPPPPKAPAALADPGPRPRGPAPLLARTRRLMGTTGLTGSHCGFRTHGNATLIARRLAFLLARRLALRARRRPGLHSPGEGDRPCYRRFPGLSLTRPVRHHLRPPVH